MLRDPTAATTSVNAAIRPAKANAAGAPALCASPPATAAPKAAPVSDAVNSDEKASVRAPAGAARSTIAEMVASVGAIVAPASRITAPIVATLPVVSASAP